MNILDLIDNNETNNFKNLVFSTTNGKLKKDNIASFNLPAGDTCPYAGECALFCYAKKGNYRFKNVKKKYSENLELSKTDNFINVVNDSIKALPNVTFYRIHSSGDFYNKVYLNKWLKIARMNPTKVFYAYTKSIVLFKGVELPDNFVLIQSEGTINDSKFLDYSKPFARVFKDMAQMNDAIESGKFIDASDSDLNAVKGALTGKNIALRIH